MSITIDLKMLLLLIICIAVIILTVYLVRCLRQLTVTLQHTNKVMEDVEVITAIASRRSQDVDGIITDVSETVSGIKDTADQNHNIISVIIAVVKAIAGFRHVADDKDRE